LPVHPLPLQTPTRQQAVKVIPNKRLQAVVVPLNHAKWQLLHKHLQKFLPITKQELVQSAAGS
jgi:hypothetical protein